MNNLLAITGSSNKGKSDFEKKRLRENDIEVLSINPSSSKIFKGVEGDKSVNKNLFCREVYKEVAYCRRQLKKSEYLHFVSLLTNEEIKSLYNYMRENKNSAKITRALHENPFRVLYYMQCVEKKGQEWADDHIKDILRLDNNLARVGAALGVTDLAALIDWKDHSEFLQKLVRRVSKNCSCLGAYVSSPKNHGKNVYEALVELQKKGSMTNGEIEYLLGYFTTYGMGLENNRKEAQEWLKQAVKCENPEGIYLFAKFYVTDANEKEKLYLSAMELGHLESEYMFSLKGEEVYEDEEEEDFMLDLYEDLAERGHLKSIYKLGKWYSDQIHFFDKSSCKYQESAIKWLTQASRLGHADALYDLGCLYRDLASGSEAIYWLERASELDDPNSAMTLGVLYEDGYGLEKEDYEKAIYWYSIGVEKGYIPCLLLLAGLYLREFNDYEKALSLYKRGENLGDEDCQVLGLELVKKHYHFL